MVSEIRERDEITMRTLISKFSNYKEDELKGIPHGGKLFVPRLKVQKVVYSIQWDFFCRFGLDDENDVLVWIENLEFLKVNPIFRQMQMLRRS